MHAPHPLRLARLALPLLLAAAPAGAQPAASCALDRVANAGRLSVVLSVPAAEPCAFGTVTLTFAGEDGRQTLQAERDGTVVGLFLVDLDRRGGPEAVVITRSVGSGSYETATVYARDAGGRWQARAVAPLAADQLQGYRGRDVFEVRDGALVRSFPIYREADAQAQPTGGQARFRYRPREDRWERF